MGKNMFSNLKRYFKSTYFLKAIVMAIAMVLPILFSNFILNDLSFGFSIALGVLFSSPADVQGSLRHKYFGILSAIVVSFIVTLLIGTFSERTYLVLPLLFILVFTISYISVFGFRASLISFAGLLAVVLSFAIDNREISVFSHALLVALGGSWFLVLTMLTSILFPKIQTDQLFVEAFENTAEFLKIRGNLLVNREDRASLYNSMFLLQTKINENHESIREVILSKRLNSGFSNRTRRQQLLFSKLIEIFELAISNPVEYEKFDLIFEKHSEKLAEFKNLIFEISNQLTHISKVILKEEKLQVNECIPRLLKKIKTQIDYYRDLVGLPESREGTILLLNLKTYQEKQIQNIIDIERVLNNYTHNNKIAGIKDAERFITTQDYDLKKLKDNFSFKSPIFKHSLRLSILMVIGFLIGNIFSMQNPYWILLTLVVIMRPSYGLTKQRSKHRVIGTLIGAAIATAVVLITQNTTVYGIIAIISLPIAFSLVQLNYRNAAVFITLNVIFVYAILDPNILSVVKFRVLDTIIGATLAFSASYFLWPAWQVQNIREFFIKSINANLNFLKEIDELYHKKGEVSTEYLLARKDAFIQVGNLNAAYQRMNQEPKSKQTNLSIIYEMVAVSNTFLSSLSSLGMFIRTNKTTKVPKQFETYILHIKNNLEITLKLLKSESLEVSLVANEIEKASKIYDDYFEKLSVQRDKEIDEGIPITNELKIQLRETKLVSEQVKWLGNLSESLIKSVKLI